ncbi:hypothetical protein Tco_0948976 [Tanacetum coccineum]
MMLSASKLPLFFCAEAIATACYTQNRSIIISTHEKTSYHIINGRKPFIKHLHIFGSICYITRDGENLNKIKEKADSCVMASDYENSGLAPQLQNVSPSADNIAPSQQELDLLFSPLYDEFFTTEPITPTTNVNAEENNNNQAADANIDENKFNNIFSTPPVQTRRQLATNPEMCIFALTVSTAEPKNIKEAMDDFIWIEEMQDELH